MAGKIKLTRVVDEVNTFSCACGVDIVIREEVFQDTNGQVVRYNLAFIHLPMCPKDNGRVLGFDNAHGHDERHFMGAVEPADFTDYDVTFARFIDEVVELRRDHEKDHHRRGKL